VSAFRTAATTPDGSGSGAGTGGAATDGAGFLPSESLLGNAFRMV
jgi:hypothetical protein